MCRGVSAKVHPEGLDAYQYEGPGHIVQLNTQVMDEEGEDTCHDDRTEQLPETDAVEDQ